MTTSEDGATGQGLGAFLDPCGPGVDLHAVPAEAALDQVCREYDLRTALERSLAAILVRNLHAARDYADHERAARKGGLWMEQRIDLVRAAVDLRLKSERGAIQAAQALLACRVPPTVNILAARVDIGGATRT